MRLALVILHADPARGGAERYTLGLAATLRRRGHEVGVIDSAALGVGGRTRAGRYRDFGRRLRARLDESRPDVTHAMLPVPPGCCDVYHPHAGVEAAGVSRWTRFANPRRALLARTEGELLAVDTHSRGLTARRSGEASDLRAVSPRLWQTPIVITLSNYVADILRAHYPDARTCRVFNAVDLDRFRPDGDRVDLGPAPIALFVGNDFDRKGLRTVVVAVNRTPDWRLAVVGNGRPFDAGDRVTFLGPRSDLPALYRSADALVHASRHDPCSLATLEALATGLPVVGTPRDGATEAMTDGVHGRVLPDPTPADIAGALSSLEPQRGTMRAACLDLRPSLSWKTHVDAIEVVYTSVQKSPPRRT